MYETRENLVDLHGAGVRVDREQGVQSMDLAVESAATDRLFEATHASRSKSELAQFLTGLTADQLKECRPELVVQILSEQTGELQRLQSELTHLQEAEATRQKHEQIKLLLREFRLPHPESGDAWARTVVGSRFLAQLLAASDEQSMRELVEERAELIRAVAGDARGGSPTGPLLLREKGVVPSAPAIDAKAFVAAIT